MKIVTKYHGEIEGNPKDIWYFPKGIPGFPDEREFLMYPLANQDVFYILQSLINSEIAFVITNPFNFFDDYDFYIDESSISTLGLKSTEEVLPFVILTLGSSLVTSTANLKAPIIFNKENQFGKQVILHDTPFHTKHFIKQKAEKR